MNFHPLSWTHFFDDDDTVIALPTWASPRLYIKSESLRQRWLDSDAFYPALTPKAKAVKFALRIGVSIAPLLFAPRKCSAIAESTLNAGKINTSDKCFAGIIVDGLIRVFPGLNQSAIAQSLFPGHFQDNNAFMISGKESEQVEFVPDSLAKLLQGVPEAVGRCVVLVGAAWDSKQKQVVRVVSKDNVILAYIKYGVAPTAQRQIQREFDILKQLPVGAGPVPYSCQQFGEGMAMMISAVHGQMVPARIPSKALDADNESGEGIVEQVADFLGSLPMSQSEYAPIEHPGLKRVRQQSFIDSTSFLHACEGRWRSVVRHGDLTPWNLFHTGNGLVAIDWEEGEIEGFPWFDLVHFVMQSGYFIQGWSARKALGIVSRLIERYGRLKSSEALAITALAVLDDYCISAEAGIPAGNLLQKFRLSVCDLAQKNNGPASQKLRDGMI